MYEDYVGMIKLYAGSTPPANWAFCDGSLIQVSDNPMLYAIIGTTYGGEVNVNFHLPNLCDHVQIGTGRGPGLSAYTPGQTGGLASVQLSANELPAHSHAFWVNSTAAGQSSAGIGSSLASMNAPSGRATVAINAYADLSPDAALIGSSVASSGQNNGHDNMQPYLGMNYIICVRGLMPSPQ